MITAAYSTDLVKRQVSLTLTLDDTTSLANKTMACSVSWGDGGLPSALTGTFPSSPVFSHEYKVDGFYIIQVNVANKKVPKADTVKLNIPVEVVTVKNRSASENLPGYIYGPILPQSRGFPTVDQWCFNTGKDIQVLETNLRLIILTSFGERLMLPNFGTNVRRLIFEKDQRLIETVLKEEISMAVARWEPRVRVESVKVTRTGDHDATLDAVFSPKDDSGGPVQVSVALTQ